jgi:dihydrofolate reductase
MRRVTAHLFSSVNGVVEDPHLFQGDAFGPEEGAAMTEILSTITDVVIGSRLWRDWSQYWPGAEDPFAAFINPVPKHVISSTLPAELGWNSTLIEGDPLDYVRTLRAGDGGDISVVGGIQTVRSLFLAGLIDRLMLTIHPVATNVGRRLFDDSVPLTRLHQLTGQLTPQGNVLVTYELAGD